jgi:hypothetical protein
MRFALALVLALAGASPLAVAQSVDLVLPPIIQVGAAFTVDISIPCPPPGELGPPPICAAPSLALFEVSERTADFPRAPFGLFPFETVTEGPFIFHRKGPQYMIVWSTEGEFLGAATFTVITTRRK